MRSVSAAIQQPLTAPQLHVESLKRQYPVQVKDGGQYSPPDSQVPEYRDTLTRQLLPLPIQRLVLHCGTHLFCRRLVLQYWR
jgi:hypothetical protein